MFAIGRGEMAGLHTKPAASRLPAQFQPAADIRTAPDLPAITVPCLIVLMWTQYVCHLPSQVESWATDTLDSMNVQHSQWYSGQRHIPAVPNHTSKSARIPFHQVQNQNPQVYLSLLPLDRNAPNTQISHSLGVKERSNCLFLADSAPQLSFKQLPCRYRKCHCPPTGNVHSE